VAPRLTVNDFASTPSLNDTTSPAAGLGVRGKLVPGQARLVAPAAAVVGSQ